MDGGAARGLNKGHAPLPVPGPPTASQAPPAPCIAAVHRAALSLSPARARRSGCHSLHRRLHTPRGASLGPAIHSSPRRMRAAVSASAGGGGGGARDVPPLLSRCCRRRPSHARECSSAAATHAAADAPRRAISRRRAGARTDADARGGADGPSLLSAVDAPAAVCPGPHAAARSALRAAAARRTLVKLSRSAFTAAALRAVSSTRSLGNCGRREGVATSRWTGSADRLREGLTDLVANLARDSPPCQQARTLLVPVTQRFVALVPERNRRVFARAQRVYPRSWTGAGCPAHKPGVPVAHQRRPLRFSLIERRNLRHDLTRGAEDMPLNPYTLRKRRKSLRVPFRSCRSPACFSLTLGRSSRRGSRRPRRRDATTAGAGRGRS